MRTVLPPWRHVAVFLAVLLQPVPAAEGAVPRPVARVPFIANTGQAHPGVAYYANIPAGTVYVTRHGEIVYALAGDPGGFSIRESFAGGRPEGATVAGSRPTGTLVNSYRGADPSRWRQGLPVFQSVDLGRRFHGVDVELVAGGTGMEKVFTVHPGGSLADIRILVENAQSLSVEEGGGLLATTPGGTVRFTRPRAFQITGGERTELAAFYRVEGSGYGFEVPGYDRSLPLVIDPLLASTYAGGGSNETAYALGVSGGDIIVAGTADSRDFPGLDDRVDPLGDAFIARLDPDLFTVRSATYFGGATTEGVRAMVVAGGAVYAAGFSNSTDFPTTPGAAYAGTSLTGSFIARFDSATLRMVAATSFHANVFGLAWSPPDGDVYVAGSTGARDLPIPGTGGPAFQAAHHGGADAFIASFDSGLRTLKAATYLGGEGFDIAYDLTVDEAGRPVVAGMTNSAAFPVSSSAFSPGYNLDWEAGHQWVDGFVARLAPDLSRLEAATYLGGGRNDSITAVTTRGSAVLVGGNTASADFPCGSTFGPIDGNDAFVVLLDDQMSRVKGCTVFGGSRPGTESPESVTDLAVHPSGAVFALGRTNASDFPTVPGAFLSRPRGAYFGAFITAFDETVSTVEASTLVHGGSEYLKAIAFDAWGDVIVAGDSSGEGYPVTPGALQPRHAGGDDVVVSRFSPDLTGPHIEAVPEILDFGRLPVGSTGRREIILHNTGGSGLAVREVGTSAGADGLFEAGDTCRLIPAFGSCSLDVLFRPVETGRRRGELVIVSDDPFRPRVTVRLEGTAVRESAPTQGQTRERPPEGVSVPRIEARPNPCEFGDVEPGASRAVTVMVGNRGRGRLQVERVTLEVGSASAFEVVRDTCTGIAIPGGREGEGSGSPCGIEVTFAPAAAGREEARLVIHSDDPSAPRYAVRLAGTGTGRGKPSSPGLVGWIVIAILVLRVVLGFPVSASGWRKWIGRKKR